MNKKKRYFPTEKQLVNLIKELPFNTAVTVALGSGELLAIEDKEPSEYMKSIAKEQP